MMKLFGLKLNSLLVIAVAALLALGAISAFADSAPPDPPGDALTVDDGDGEPDGDGDGDVDDDDGDEVDGNEVELQGGGGGGEGAANVALVIGDVFGASDADVLTLHEAGFGFGALFKLYLLAAAGDETAVAILADGEKGEGGFAFGKLLKELSEEVSVLSAGEDGMPTNLGKAVSGAKKDDEVVVLVDGDDGQGPPEHAPAHGRSKD